jgi:hypothetical protein
VRRQALDRAVIAARRVAGAGPLDLDDAGAQLGELPRAERAAITCSSATTVMPSSGRFT